MRVTPHIDCAVSLSKVDEGDRMRKKRLTAVMLSVSLTLPLMGCEEVIREGLSDFLNIEIPDDEEAEREEFDVPHYDFELLQAPIDGMTDIWTQYGHDALIESHIEYLLDQFNVICETYLQKEMEYYEDWNHAEKEAIYQAAYQDYYVAADMLGWAFTNGAHKSVYQSLFEPYSDEANADYYLSYNLSRIKMSAKKYSTESQETLDDYYDIAYKEPDAMESEETLEDTNLECAQLYLDTIGQYDLSDCLYSFYSRDYEAEDVSGLYQTIVDEIAPLYLYHLLALQEAPAYEKLETAEFVVDENPFETVWKYGSQLSEPIQESADKLWNESLYMLGTEDKSYEGGYTVSFPTRQSAMIYLYTEGDYYDLMGAIHEFGHFHCDWRDQTPLYCQQNCIDLAEIQSQGMQMLFTQFYNDLYGENAEFMRDFTLLDLLESVVSGFAVGEFEYRVMRDYDQMTAEKVVALFEEIADECYLDYELYEISHLYEQPGYYISYGVSALAALQIYAKMQHSPEEAQEMYDALSAISSVTGEYTLCAALEECGFEDLFDADAMKDIIAVLPSDSESDTE